MQYMSNDTEMSVHWYQYPIDFIIARQHAMHAEHDTVLRIPSVCLVLCLNE